MSSSAHALISTHLRLPGRRQGKVRDIYDLPTPEGIRVLMVATDRLSAFDVVLPTPIPGKGRLLTQLSAWWFRWLAGRAMTPNHLLSVDADAIPRSALEHPGQHQDLSGRVMIGRRCRVLPVECVVRGYIEGSGWRDYQSTGMICGIRLPTGLRQCDRLPEPIFTPSTKAQPPAHDEPITLHQAGEMVGPATARTLRDRSLAIYAAAAAHALDRGVIIADCKFEFGIPIDDAGRDLSDEPMLIDEVLTPDASRFWPAELYRPGGPQPSFDKQYVREFLECVVAQGRWDKRAPGPALPAEIVQATLERYRSAVRAITGESPTA